MLQEVPSDTQMKLIKATEQCPKLFMLCQLVIIYCFQPITFSFQAATPKPTFVEKPVKGAKNGETRMVRVKRLRNDVPTIEK